MSDDPYEVLGVSRTASQDEIRKAYRKLAKESHPDLHPGDRQAEERFKRVTAAYDLLGDPDKRARYDRGEIDATGAERPQRRYYREYADADGGEAHPYQSRAGFADFDDLGDVFADLFGAAAAGRGGAAPGGARAGFAFPGADVRYELTVDFLAAVNGATTRVTLPDGKALDISIPAGLRDGQVLRLKGQGMPGVRGGPPGDALVTVHIRPHPFFERRGDEIHMELPITLAEAVLGGRVRVPTPTGPVNATVPEGSNTGRSLRLRGKGVPDPRTGRRGDMYVRLKVVLPEQPDPELEGFVKEWAAKHPYDPRRGMAEG